MTKRRSDTVQSQILSFKKKRYHKDLKQKARHTKAQDKDTRLFYAACGLFIIGIAFGSVVVTLKDQTVIQYLNLLTKNGIESRTTARFLVSFIQCLLPNLIFLLLCFISANCAIGLPVIISVLIVRGVSVGLIGGYVYFHEGIRGFLYSLVLLVPPVLVFVLSLIQYAIIACKSSVYIFGMVYRNIGRNMKSINAALLQSLFMTAIASCASAALEAVLYIAFGSMFIH